MDWSELRLQQRLNLKSEHVEHVNASIADNTKIITTLNSHQGNPYLFAYQKDPRLIVIPRCV